LAPFHRETPGQAAFTVDLYVREEDSGRDPALYTYFLEKLPRGQAEERSLGDNLAMSIWDIWRAFAMASRDFLLLHAGVVSRGGVGVLMPAPMDSGKSSLTLSLLLEGFAFLSDEFGAIDPVTGSAYPVPRPLGFDPDLLERFPMLEGKLADKELPVRLTKRFVRAEDVGATIGTPSPIRWIVFPTDFFDGPPRLIPITRAAAVEHMLRNSFNTGNYGERGVVLLSRVAEGAQTFRLEGGTPAERSAMLSEAVGA
jgi:hypothetical protein